ncbi:hypothetical protein K2Y11_23495 [bacterium]|nr:hypothetical protein [bacterium]
MIPKTTSIFWFTAWRIGAIVLLLSLIGYIVWLQRYTFTDKDVASMFDVTVHRLRLDVKKGQMLRFGIVSEGARNSTFGVTINDGSVELTIAVRMNEHDLSVAFKEDPIRWQRRRTWLTHQSGFGKTTYYVNDPTTITFPFIKENDGSVWLAEWNEEINGQTKKVRYGFWLE